MITFLVIVLTILFILFVEGDTEETRLNIFCALLSPFILIYFLKNWIWPSKGYIESKERLEKVHEIIHKMDFESFKKANAKTTR